MAVSKQTKGATIRDVAELAGVSVATVSRYLNHPERIKKHTRLKVQQAILDAGYIPNVLARNFRMGSTNTIIVAIRKLGDPFMGPVMQGIRNVADAHHYSILVAETHADEMKKPHFNPVSLFKQVDGMLLLGSISPLGADVLSAQRREPLPIVIAFETISDELADYPSVRIDNVAAAKEAVEYLVSIGHTDIALIAGIKESLQTKDREIGYARGMQEAGLLIEAGWIEEGHMTANGGIEAARKLLNHHRPPTAIFCINDEMAIGALHEIKAMGLSVPSDISLVGFDDVRYAGIIDPPLTTIAQPKEEIGKRAMYKLISEIDGKAPASGKNIHEVIPHKLIVRRSTRALS